MTPTPPPGSTATDWTDFGDRFWRGRPAAIADITVTLTGTQHRDGFTASSVEVALPDAVVVAGRPIPVAAHLTTTQARQLAGLLLGAADRADHLDAQVPGVGD